MPYPKYPQQVRRLLSVKWMGLHLVVLLLAAGMVKLGLWQYHRAEERHTLQNYSYAAEWVLFAVFTVVAYAKLARDELRGVAPKRAVVPPGLPIAQLPVAVPVTDEQDPELAAYNRYLAALNAASQEKADQ